MAFWQIPPPHLAADPPVAEVTAAGAWPLKLDLAPYLSEGQVPKNPRATLTDIATGRDIPVRVLPLKGTTMTVVVRGLEAGHDYRLIYTWAITPFDQPSKIQIVRCVS